MTEFEQHPLRRVILSDKHSINCTVHKKTYYKRSYSSFTNRVEYGMQQKNNRRCHIKEKHQPQRPGKIKFWASGL